MQQKFRMFLYIIRPIGICVKICDYVNQNTAHSRGIDLSERTVLEMSVITKAGLLALAAVLLLPSAQTTQAAQPEPLIVIVQKRQDAQERTLRVLRTEAWRRLHWIPIWRRSCCRKCPPRSRRRHSRRRRWQRARSPAGRRRAASTKTRTCARRAPAAACLTVEGPARAVWRRL